MATTKKAASGSKKTTTKQATRVKSTTAKKPVTTTVKTVAVTRRPRTRFTFVNSSILAASIAEFVGTFLLAAVVVSLNGSPLFVALSLVGIVLLIGVVSGAHVNPAITIAAWVTRKITAGRAIAYIVAQVLGGSLALFTLNFFAKLAPQQAAETLSATGQAAQSAVTLFTLPALQNGTELAIGLVEVIGAIILGMGVAAALRAKQPIQAAFSVGLSLLIGLAISMAAVSFIYGAQAGTYAGVFNPAVAITLQTLVTFNITNFATYWPLAVYIIAPVIGAIIGFLIYELIRVDQEEETVA